MGIDLPHLDDSTVVAVLRADVPGALRALAQRVRRAGPQLVAGTAVVRACGELAWESAAADLYEREVDGALADLLALEDDVAEIASGLEALAATVADRVDLLRAARLPVIGILP